MQATVKRRNDEVLIGGYETLDKGRLTLTDEISLTPSAALDVAESMIVEALRLMKATEQTSALSGLVSRVQVSVFGARTAASDALEGR